MQQETKKSIVIIGGILITVFVLFAIKAAVAGKSFSDYGLGLSTDSDTSGVQEVTLTLDPQTLDYAPNPIRVKAGIPVRITVDLNSVRGCTASVRMPAFGIQKRAIPGDNVIEFTPEKPGTFPFSCSMGMAQGTIIVE